MVRRKIRENILRENRRLTEVMREIKYERVEAIKEDNKHIGRLKICNGKRKKHLEED